MTGLLTGLLLRVAHVCAWCRRCVVAWLPVCVSVDIWSAFVSVCLPPCLPVFLSVRLSMSVCLWVCLPVRLQVEQLVVCLSHERQERNRLTQELEQLRRSLHHRPD
jgi:hypothetical protein